MKDYMNWLVEVNNLPKMDYLEELLRCFESDLIENSFQSIKKMLDEKNASGLDNLNVRLDLLEKLLDHAKWQLGSVKQVVGYVKEAIENDKN